MIGMPPGVIIVAPRTPAASSQAGLQSWVTAIVPPAQVLDKRGAA